MPLKEYLKFVRDVSREALRLISQLTLSDNVAGDIVTESQVAGDSNKQIDTA
jgi:hypothetical protein